MKAKFFLMSVSIFAILTFFSCKTDSKKKNNTSEETKTELNSDNPDQRKCFMYEMDSSYEKDGKTIVQKDYISVDLVLEGEKATGEYKISNSKEILSDGHFVGTIKNNIITTIHTYNKGGETLKDELIFKLDSNKISILGGEKKLVNGVNIFIDKSKGEYMLEIPKINCN